jgi:hypothetical protein
MTQTRTETDADAFVRSWLAAWNAHDLDAITSHYREDVEYYSPFVAQFLGDQPLSGRQALRDYAARALDRFPALHLGPILTVAVGVNSIAMVYWSVNDLLAVETLVLDDDGLVARAYCHYRADIRTYP